MREQNIEPGIAIYLRVSDKLNQHPEESFDYQRNRIMRLPIWKDTDLELKEEYRDVFSGQSSARPAFQRMMEDARAGKFSTLIAYSHDRIGRNHLETLTDIDELTDLGIRLLASDSPDLGDSPSGNLFLRIRVAIAQFETDMASQRVSDSKRASVYRGDWPFPLPDGYRRVDSHPASKKNRHLTIEFDPERADMWREVWALWLTDTFTLESLCQELHDRGYIRKSGKPWAWTTKRGTTKYAVSHLHGVLHHPFYAGWVRSKAYGITYGEIRGNWPALISDKDYEKGIAILKKHDHNKVRTKRRTYLLSGLLYVTDFQRGKSGGWIIKG
jgi:DNA invertase Pin-like site-specific DNA recombinase